MASVDNVYVQTVPVMGREEDMVDIQQTVYYTGNNNPQVSALSSHAQSE